MTRIDALPHATLRRTDIARRVAGRRLAVFLDYDGTLAPIVDDPDAAAMAPRTAAALARLAAAVPTAIVSGRDAADVRARVGLRGLVYAGSHGFDITDADGAVVHQTDAAAALPSLDAAESALRERLRGTGASVERKRYAIAVHFRRASSAEPAVEAAVAEQLDAHDDLRRSGGKMIVELRPALDWDKGRAVEALLDAAQADGGPDRRPVLGLYVGDDLTDEDAFALLAGRGVGVVVRGGEDRDTAAHYSLADPDEVAVFLEELAALAESVGP